MNLYLIRRNGLTDYDQFSKAVVVAKSAEEARNVHPRCTADDWRVSPDDYDWSFEWVSPEDVIVEYLGEAHSDYALGTVVCASYHAG